MANDRWTGTVAWVGGALLLASSLVLQGCGSADDFEAGSRLVIVNIVDSENSANTPVFFVVEETDDTGEDGQPDTSDPGENDGFPDEGETIVTDLENDMVDITVRNQPRPGVPEVPELFVHTVVVTYRDKFGRPLGFLPTDQQQVIQSVSASVEQDEEVTLEDVVVLSKFVKEAWLRQVFLFDFPEQKANLDRLTATIDIYATDILNDDDVHAQGSITLWLVDPNR
ncbi:hypothetical protein [Deferrisoma palaeochoriense]